MIVLFVSVYGIEDCGDCVGVSGCVRGVRDVGVGVIFRARVFFGVLE